MNKVRFLVATVLAVLLAACSEEENVSQAGKPGFVVSLTESVKVESRRTPEGIGKPAASNFQLKITRQSDGFEAYNGSYTATIPAPVGMYTLEATHGDNPVLALDAPYYKGTAEAEVVSETESTPVTIQCMVANALASVVFDDSGAYKFDDQFSSYEVRVAFPSISTVLGNDGKSAYYRAGTKPVFTFEGTLEDGTHIEPVPLTDEKLSDNTTFAAGQHCIIKLRLGATSSGVRVEVSKVEVKPVTINETIPLEWLPKPKVEAEGFTDNVLSMYETETPTAKFNFNLSSALQELKFTLNFADETYQALNKTYTLSELSEEDKTALTEAGVVLPAIGSKEATLDFTDLAAKLTGSTTGEVLSNVITLDEVRANNRVLEGNQTYTIQTSAPDFNLVVYPGNIWSKQFTANTEITHGNAEVIRNGMTFEYRSVGTEEWISSPDSIIDGLPQDKEKETAYQVRGKFGKHYTEVVNAKTYPAIPLENGNMESWHQEGKDGNPFDNYGARFYWDYWATINELTCDYCPWAAYAYNTRSGTRAITGSEAYEGTTAWIATIGWGYGSNIGKTNKQSPGELFWGTTSNVNHNDDTIDKTYGKEYFSHPTSVSFMYKYIPYDNDKSDIYVQILHDDEILGEAKLQEDKKMDDYSLGKLDINYYYPEKITLSPNKLIIVFKSGENSSVQNYGNDGRYGVKFIRTKLWE